MRGCNQNQTLPSHSLFQCESKREAAPEGGIISPVASSPPPPRPAGGIASTCAASEAFSSSRILSNKGLLLRVRGGKLSLVVVAVIVSSTAGKGRPFLHAVFQDKLAHQALIPTTLASFCTTSVFFSTRTFPSNKGLLLRVGVLSVSAVPLSTDTARPFLHVMFQGR